MMKLTVLGSGSPEAYARRASSGYLVEIGEDRILFDCGGGVFDNLLRAGRLPRDITHIVFSHLHSDHMMDYARLVHAAWDEGGAAIKVYGPAPIKAITEGYFGPNGVMAHDLWARTELKPSQEVWLARGGTLPRPWPNPEVCEISPGDVIEGGGWQIKSCEVPHAQPALTCMGFALMYDDKTFVYSGDAAICDDMETLCQDADLLLHWCYRLDGQKAHPVMHALTPTPSQIAAMATRCRVKQLMLTHFRINMDDEAGHKNASKAMRAEFDGLIGIVEDLDSYSI
ncbi:MBL fold metallo-hydrolase [Lentibacter algarum]|uniref:MBL fold metallo-hydrolase n=1 Tax=Lentibacter algarum TaxID=576131 RepID=UPI002352F392|nr:MBL fold metallo-hydrolase [Lentibacter algarum]